MWDEAFIGLLETEDIPDVFSFAGLKTSFLTAF